MFVVVMNSFFFFRYKTDCCLRSLGWLLFDPSTREKLPAEMDKFVRLFRSDRRKELLPLVDKMSYLVKDLSPDEKNLGELESELNEFVERST